MSAAGEPLWELALQEAAPGSLSDVRASGERLLIAGHGAGGWGGENLGSYDGFVAELSPEGALRWVAALGRAELDQATGVVAGASALFVTQNVRSRHRGGSDAAYLLRLREPAELSPD